MGIVFSDSVELRKKAPLDERIMKATIQDMVDQRTSRLYDGAICYVQDVDKYYSYNSDNEDDPVLKKWRELDFGGSALSFDIKPTTSVGGVNSSSDAYPVGTSLETILSDILCPEVEPTMTFTASGSGYKEVGTSVTTSTLTAKLTNLDKTTDKIVRVEFKKNGISLGFQRYVEGQDTYTLVWEADESISDVSNRLCPITTDTAFQAILYYKNKKNEAVFKQITANFKFTYKTYFGGLDTADSISADTVASLSSSIVGSTGSTQKYTLSNKIMVYAIPKSFGAITKIVDTATNYTLNWSNKEIYIGDVAYYVYYSGVCAVSNYSVKFS